MHANMHSIWNMHTNFQNFITEKDEHRQITKKIITFCNAGQLREAVAQASR